MEAVFGAFSIDKAVGMSKKPQEPQLNSNKQGDMRPSTVEHRLTTTVAVSGETSKSLHSQQTKRVTYDRRPCAGIVW
jgi:hypothetical protein